MNFLDRTYLGVMTVLILMGVYDSRNNAMLVLIAFTLFWMAYGTVTEFEKEK